MTGRRPGGKVTPPAGRWVTTGIQWSCTFEGDSCDGSTAPHNPDKTAEMWAAARKHQDEHPDHEVVLDRFQRIALPARHPAAKGES